MYRNFARRNITSIAIVIFAITYGLIILSKTSLIYNKDGTLKQFGIGYSTRSILPAWVVVIVLAILSYLCVLYYVSVPTMQF